MPDRSGKIYSATYSNVPVYEFNIGTNHIMRRRSDDWINATHILKIADHDKPARTRILEREVQKGVHEKIQGGYGKYQGTWIPLPDGRLLAEKNGVLEKLLPMFDFVPGDRSPPPAPKHATATTNKPRAPRQSNNAKKSQASAAQQPQQSQYQNQKQQQPPQQQQQQQPKQPQHQQKAQVSEIVHNAHSTVQTPSGLSVESESDHEAMSRQSQYSTNHTGRNRKRKRLVPEEPEAMSYEEQQHLLWTDELLDYFMLQNSNDPLPTPPQPPETIDLNQAVDDKGHTPMHWAAAMGDLSVVIDLDRRHARRDCQAHNGETPLMRAVLFTNNFDRQTMDRLIQILHPTIYHKDFCGSTVFHHIAATTCSKSKYQCAKYYLDTILERISGTYAPQRIVDLLDQRDQNGDTAILIAARFGARKCVRTLLNYGANVSIQNRKGQKAEELIEQLNARRRERYGLNVLNITSSSPVAHGATGSINATQQRNASLPNAPGSQTRTNGSAILPSSATGTPHSLKHIALGSKRQKLTSYHSEAAQLLASQLPVLISSRTEALATALETELLERENEVAEGERVLETRRRDLAELKTRYERVRRESAGSAEDLEAEYSEMTELAWLTEETRKLLKDEQMREVARLMGAKTQGESFLSADDSGIAMLTNGVSHRRSPSGSSELESEEKLRLAHMLADKQAEQARLLEAMVAAQTNQTNGNEEASKRGSKDDLYKRLITASLAVSPEDVEAMLPDILQELEDDQRERDHGIRFPVAAASSSTPAAMNLFMGNAGYRDTQMTDVDRTRDPVRVAA